MILALKQLVGASRFYPRPLLFLIISMNYQNVTSFRFQDICEILINKLGSFEQAMGPVT